MVYLTREAGVDKALEFQECLDKSVAQLLVFPDIGAPRPLDARHLPNARMWQVVGFENYLIFYEPLKKDLRLLALVHAKEDYWRVLLDKP